jgi:ATP-dependent Clp protease adaptor protein ClpS
VSDTDRPAIAKVLLLNDDETTMEFVVQVLEGVFERTREEALKLVLEVHRDGSGVCGVYTVERASEIVARVTELARRNRYPMRCVIEPTSRV